MVMAVTTSAPSGSEKRSSRATHNHWQYHKCRSSSTRILLTMFCPLESHWMEHRRLIPRSYPEP
ncbi:hypothetical protein SK128_002132, partial [Halocaridina rubra]